MKCFTCGKRSACLLHTVSAYVIAMFDALSETLLEYMHACQGFSGECESLHAVARMKQNYDPELLLFLLLEECQRVFGVDRVRNKESKAALNSGVAHGT
jgi:hypothetical protein